MSDCREFYRLRNRRTTEYVDGAEIGNAPVHVAIDAGAAECGPGQLTLLALANQLARVHRQISFHIQTPDVPVLVHTPFGGTTLAEALLQTVNMIDPCGIFALGERPDDHAISLGIGEGIGNGFDWYLGADRAIARLERTPVATTPARASLRGAGLAACLGAAAVFRTQLGREVVPRILSAWNYAEGATAAPGPDTFEQLDVGRVLMVGAGAVGASLVYWQQTFGVAGEWTIIDGDAVELHNANRGLVFTAAHAGWPDPTPERAAKKAEVVAALIPGARAIVAWYDECPTVRNEKFDVLLGLANDRNVRHLIASRNAAITLHATTGRNWLSELHRHITGRDDCIWCRVGEVQTPILGCSTVSVKHQDGTSSDAALPFLSAASGLMLATALQRLQHGEIADGARNDWRWDFDSPYRMATSGVRRCAESCRHVHPAHLRRRINEGTRWAALDGGSPATTV
jgi:hypothetical protein